MNLLSIRYAGVRTFLAAALFLVAASLASAQGRTLYVATNGTATNPGTDASPLSLTRALQIAVGGDTILLKNGTYRPTSSLSFTNSGNSTANGRIVLRAVQRHQAIIDGGTTVPNNGGTAPGGPATRLGLIEIAGRAQITIDGIRIQNSGFFGIRIADSSNITIQNCYTYQTYASGIAATNSSTIRILDNTVQRACYHPVSTVGTSECITLSNVDGFEIARNTVFDRTTDLNQGGEGIDAKNGARNGSIYGNTVYDLIRLGIYVDAFSRSTFNIDVYGNRVFNCVRGGITVGSEDGGTVSNVRVHDNVVRDISGGAGIRLTGYPGVLKDGPIQNVSVYQNTIVRTGSTTSDFLDAAILYEGKNSANSGIVIRNNILVQNNAGRTFIRTNGQPANTYTIDRNLVFGTNQSGAGTVGTNFIGQNPLFVDFANNDFRLTATSPARDAVLGTPLSTRDFNGTVRGAGSQGDLGAFEYTP